MSARSWDAIQAIKVQLQQITIANGYRTGIGALVLDEQPEQDTTDKFIYVDAASISVPGGEGISKFARAMDVAVLASIPSDYTNANAHKHLIAADIEQALADKNRTADAPYAGVQMGETRFNKRADGINSIVVECDVTVSFRTQ